MASHPPSPSEAGPKEGSAAPDNMTPDWDAIAAMPEFKALTQRKGRFIIGTTIFFLVYYFALPVLVGYFPRLMEQRVGSVNWAYLFALSQFIMAWIVAAIYVKVAAGWDKASDAIIANHAAKAGSK